MDFSRIHHGKRIAWSWLVDHQVCWWLCFSLACTLGAQQPAAENKQLAVLEGIVLHGITKEPVRKAHVTLELSGRTHNSALVATTDESGRFRFSDIEEGEYELTAAKTGFLDATYGEVEPEGQGSLLRVRSGDRIQDLTVRLFPAGEISGHVLDSVGDPVPDDTVVLWTRRHENGEVINSRTSEANTNQAGEYRFDGLSPGTYYVSASAGTWGDATRQVPVDSSGKATKIHDLTTFYPAAVSLSDAQPVTLSNGQEQSGVDIRIQRGATLSVKGKIAGFSGSLSRYGLGATVDDGIGWTSEPATILPNGDFVVPELPPGKHTLVLMDQGLNGAQAVGKAEVNLTDADVTGIVITPFKPAQVRVRVVVEGEEDKPLTDGSVFLNPVHDNGGHVNRLMQYRPQNGTYIIDAVPPGKYEILFSNASDYYLKSVKSGEQKLDGNSIEVSEGAVLDLQMKFSRNVAELSGDVEVPQDQPKRSAHVLVLSEEPDEVWQLKRRWPELDQFLHFGLRRMRPGKYLAFAVQEDDSELWSNPEFVALLRSEGTEVELHENDHPAVHLKLISKDETDGVRKRLGL
jgi:hypothetical protein